MLASLIGNKSIEKILFFLLLNGKAYASQLSQRFEAPLTPLQHSLQKLEKNDILLSHYEGKTRFYKFNPSYPLLSELETLLKKAYTFLPIPEQKLYYSPSFSMRPQVRRKPFSSSAGKQTVLKLWDKLGGIQTMCFSAKSKALGHSTSGWNGIGKGSVDVKVEEENTLIFHERGSWTSEDSKELDFSNVFRWVYQPSREAITLEHLRFGAQNPVFLFSLIAVDENTLESIDSHVCNNDSYFGQIRCDKHFVQFNWRIIGPKKNEEIDYLYT
jgi:hypothetical protein